MNIIVITQEDVFFIPKNIKKLIFEDSINVKGVYIVDGKGSIKNKSFYFFRGFGILQSIRYGLKLVFKKIKLLINDICFDSKESISLGKTCDQLNIEYKKIKDPNHVDFLNSIKSKKLDLIVSFSAPIVFKKILLNIPRYGCINLHCSLLPEYSGLMPSFWVLFKNENYTGVTVHMMDDKIDNGSIIFQKKIDIRNLNTIFEVIRKTKLEGGNLMIDCIKKIKTNKFNLKKNKQKSENYFSWPTISEMKKFRKNGGKFI